MKNKYVVMGNTVFITLRRREGKPLKTMVSKRHLPMLRSIDCSWCAMQDYSVKIRDKFYVVARIDGKQTLLHKLLIDCPEGYVIDHKNGNSLNNLDSNLRLLTNSQNAMNRRGAELRSKSGVLGVHWDKRRGKWRARVKHNGKEAFEKHFDDLEEAEREVTRVREAILNGKSY